LKSHSSQVAKAVWPVVHGLWREEKEAGHVRWGRRTVSQQASLQMQRRWEAYLNITRASICSMVERSLKMVKNA
jgi:hypothetical protein